MVKQTAHDSLDECSNHSGLTVIITTFYIIKKSNIIKKKKKIRVLELVDRANLRFADFFVNVQVVCRIAFLLVPYLGLKS